jgi:fumarate reductase flavoprotein subunit
MTQSLPLKENKATYAIFNDKIWDIKFPGDAEAKAEFEEALKTNAGDCLYKANSIEELADIFGLDRATLSQTITEYNAMCAEGEDTDFAKEPEALVPINEAPYYIAKLTQSIIVTLGGITTNLKREVVDNNQNPIRGLYAIGCDGLTLYRNMYTINVPGTAFGNSVNSGRVAANSAAAFIGA